MTPHSLTDPPSFVSIEAQPLLVGRGSDADVRLYDQTVSRRHGTIHRSDGRFAVEDHDSRFGTFVNGTRIRTIGLQPGDRIRFGTTVTYRVDAQGLILERSNRGMGLSVADLAVSRDAKVLLWDANLEIHPDEFVGILGPSGAGKSTLLNCLATYLRPGRGCVRFDDHHDPFENLDHYRATLGHVPQEDVLYPGLTARENLIFAASLRLGPLDAETIEGAADRVLEQVGLTVHAEKRAEVLSGGQKKRLSVAVELLKQPRLLLLDEPTSGLDPATEANLMEQLRAIARRGTTVVCTTHLMENVRLFDTVIVLGVAGGRGRVAFVGPPSEMLVHFDCRNFADMYEKLENGGFVSSGADAPLPAVVCSPATTGAGNEATSRRADTGSITSSPAQPLRQLVDHPSNNEHNHQLWLLVSRALVLKFRDRSLLITLIAQPLILGLLVCLSQHAASRAVPLLFFMVVVAIWLGLNNSVRDLVRERKQYIRERLAGLRPRCYLASKWLIHTAAGLAQVLFLVLMIRGTTMLLPEGALADELLDVSLSRLLFVLMAAYTGGLGAGLLFSALARSEEAAIAALPLLIMPQLLVSAVGAGQVEQVFYTAHDARPFRPLPVKLKSDGLSSPAARALDIVSLGCFSRPAILLLKSPTVSRDFGRKAWLADLCHLVVLIAGTWSLTFLAFHWAEQRWTQLIGVG